VSPPGHLILAVGRRIVLFRGLAVSEGGSPHKGVFSYNLVLARGDFNAL
jgi:hypothetical protein